MGRMILKMNKPFIKPVILLLTMIVLSFIIGQALTGFMPKKTVTEETRFRKQASKILERIASSESCLAVREGEKTIDLNVLEDFQLKYPDIEPDCARNYDYGYNIEVEVSGVKIGQFGSMNHSEYDALKGSVMLLMPVMIKDGDEIRSGMIKIKLYKGELEELVGLIDKTCDTGLEILKSIYLSYPVEFRDNSVCMKARDEFCRKLGCESVDFKGVSHPGNHTFLSRWEWDVVKVEVKKTG